MTFPLSLLLIPYGFFLIIWGFLSLVGFYHIARYGGRHVSTFILGLVYFLGCVTLLQVSYMYLAPIDWNQSITIFEVASKQTIFSNF
ncbi:MAG TPA: hypothetical protein PK720_00450 [bacterium]|jgi:hypothetical protein|nr:hypothetical protein [bacterium]